MSTTHIRRLSQSVSFTSGKSRLRVPLLKSPSHFGHFTSRVNRITNEDRYSAAVLSVDGRTVFNFNVFDGHGGAQCLTYLAEALARMVEESALPADSDGQSALFKAYASNVGGYWKRWYKHRLDNVATMAATQPQVQSLSRLAVADDMMLRLPLAFLQSDYQFFNQEDNALGSTCLLVYLETVHADEPGEAKPAAENYYFNRKTVSKLSVAHVGDTKALLVDRNGLAHALTRPHHPLNPVEARRLRRYSGSCFMTDSFGEERFVLLANTRAFGDLDFKQMGVTAEPDVSQYMVGDSDTILRMLTPEEVRAATVGGLGGDESFLVLCTDGITNEITDQEIADIVMANYNLRGSHKATPQFCAQEVVSFVEYIGGDDNATCLVVRLSGWGKWPVVDRTGELRQERLNGYQPRDRG